MLMLETSQATYGSGFGGAQATGANTSAGAADNSFNGIQELIEQYKNNPQELLLLLLYVYLPEKEEGLGNYVGNIGKMLKEEAKFLDKWNDLQDKLNQLAAEARDQHLPFFSKKYEKDFLDYKKALKNFQKAFFDATHSFDGHNKFPVNSDTQDFIDTIGNAINGLLNNTMMTDPIVFASEVQSKDQTAFKAYMNNFSTGNTAFTSISNYTQEEMQLYGKQYDSGEGLIKSGLKAFTTQEQTIVNNQRSS